MKENVTKSQMKNQSIEIDQKIDRNNKIIRKKNPSKLAL